MVAGHGHSTDADAGPVTVGARARLVLVLTLGIFAAATLFGLVRFWPDSDTVRAAMTATDFAAPGVTFPQGPITSVTPACSTEGLRAGDVVQLMRVPAGDGVDTSYSFIQVQRGTPLLILLIIFGVAITAALGMAAVGAARLSGVRDDEGATLASFVPTMHPRELLACAIIVAGLGVLNDVTITQSSAVWELRTVAPG